MKATELRIGNIISFKGNLIKIDSIEWDDVEGWWIIYYDGFLRQALLVDCEAVKLEEKSLEMLGAVVSQMENWDYELPVGALKLRFRLYATAYSSLEDVYLGQHIKFAHQLQNFCHAFTGKELEFTL